MEIKRTQGRLSMYGNVLLKLTMKLSIFLCCTIAFAFGPNKSSAQNATIVIESDQTLSVQQVFRLINKQTDYKFIYRHDLLMNAPELSLKKGVIKTGDLLEQSLSPIDFSYKFTNDGTIIVIKKPEAYNSETPLTKQTQSILTGTVSDLNGAPLPGANIIEKGTTNGVTADFDGNFSIDLLDEDAILMVSYIGFAAKEIPVNGQSSLNIVLEEDTAALDEVVVVGYGSVKKGDLTGSVSSISSEDIVQYPVSDPQRGLQGRTSGVSVVQNSSAPGAPVNVRIRGSNSILGNNEPLYVVDGFALSGSPSALNPNDIQSMEVLKDASSTAIYGSRGANGVILITTKSGTKGKSTVTYENYSAYQEVSKTIDLMNAREFAEIANERALNDGLPPYFSDSQVNSFSEGTNWQKELFRSALIQNHFLSFSGGSENTQYFFSGNIFDQNGIIPNSSLKKISIRANVSRKISDKFMLTFNSSLTKSDLYAIDVNGQKGGTTLSAALVGPPTVSPYDANGDYSEVRAYSFSPNELDNPLAMAKERKQLTVSKNVIVNSSLAYEPIENLIFKTSFGVESDVSRENYYSSKILDRTPTGSGRISSMDMTNVLNENTITYSKNYNDIHNLNALVGFTYQENNILTYDTGSVTGFLSDKTGEYDLGAGSESSLPQSELTKWALLSYLGRINYSYKDKYLLTASIRSDGSSRFSEGNKWGYFPSAAFGWRVLNEDFMKGMDYNTISNLKLRLSWGITGNTGIDPYQTLNTLNTYSTVFDDSRYIGFAPSNRSLANPDLKWEKTSQVNAGLDVGLLKNRLSLTFDYYRKDTKDLLAFNQLPTSTGYRNTISNVGKIMNEGIEFELSSLLIDQELKWTLSANLTSNKSKVVSLPGGSDIFGEQIPQPLSVSVNLLREQEPVGVFYGFLEDGLNENGEIAYRDIDGNGEITADDRTIIGDPNPDFTYNLQSRLSYKNFDFDFMFQGVSGGDVFNVNNSSVANSFYFGENQLKEVYYDHWSPSNPDPNAKYPKISTSTTFSASDRFVENGSYLRLKNIQLGYNFGVDRIGIKGKLYISGQNLLTFTDYSWYNPEVNSRGGSTSFSNGIDNLSYPISKIYTVGVNLQF